VRYLFSGRRQQTGGPIEGRVTAPTEAAAYDVLRVNGIVADSLHPEPGSDADAAATSTEARLAHALQRALADAGFGVSFDLTTNRYQGKSVCLLDQDQVHTRLIDLMGDDAVAHLGGEESRLRARRSLAQLVADLLGPRQCLDAGQSVRSPALESQVNHIALALGRLERAMASMSSASRHAGRDRSRLPGPGPTAGDRTRDAVLTEVFETNLELMRGFDEPALLPAPGST
jgi:hypothetical protein